MTEKKESPASIEKSKRFRGIGVLVLCMLLAAAGLWKFSPPVTSVSSRVGSRELPICSVDDVRKRIAISFECVDDNDHTQEILDILGRQQVKATFFLSLEWVERYPKEVRQIQSMGHELGNYGSGSGSMEQLSMKKYRECIRSVEKKVKDAAGIELELFRPPLGKYDNRCIRTAIDMGYYPIGWSVDSMDWKDYGAESIRKRVCKSGLKAGEIIRFQSDAKYTADALDKLIEELRDRGFEIVPVGRLIYRENYYMDENGRQISRENKSLSN